ncbi:NAD(P)/FAD-dependent oxidoreductase [Actinosynnema sp. NPDC059797]
MGRTVDVAVIGAGVVGLSAALELAGRGASVVVLDADADGGRGSRAAAGVAIPSLRLRSDPLLRRFADEGRARLDEDVAAFEPIHPGIRRGHGVLRPVLAGAEEDALRAVAAQDPDSLGTWADAEEMAELEPVLRGSPYAGAFVSDNGYVVDTGLYLDALAAGARAAGTTVRLGVSVLGVDTRTGGVDIATTAGGLTADRLVVAAGAWSATIPGIPTLDVFPLLGQMIELRHPAHQLRRLVSSRTYLAPWRAGGICLGATEERVGFADGPTALGSGYLLSRLVRNVPALAAARIRTSWTGLRSASPDGRPLVGFVDGHDRRVVVGTGHGGQGILTGRHTGRLLADLVEDRADALPVEFAPHRATRHDDDPITAPESEDDHG